MSDVPSTASVQPDPVPPAVTDRRPVPRGVLPRGVQTWIMAGVAVGMLAIMLIVGRPDPPPRPAQAAAPAQAPSADRVRDYQDRLRLLEAQALREAQMATVAPAEPTQYDNTAPAPVQDPIAEERKRREYREPLCEQRRAQPASRKRTTGSGRDRDDGRRRSRAARLTKSVCRGSG